MLAFWYEGVKILFFKIVLIEVELKNMFKKVFACKARKGCSR